MDIAATMEPDRTVREETTAHRSRLWPSLIAAWTRHLDRRIEADLHRLDHTGALEDFRSASGG